MFRLEIPWTQKPPIGTPIDWSNPLTRGLVGVWAFNEGSGNSLCNIVDGTRATIGGTGAQWVPEGLQTATTSNIRLIDNKLNNQSWDEGISVVWFGRLLDDNFYYPMLVTQDDYGTVALNWNFGGLFTTKYIRFEGTTATGIQNLVISDGSLVMPTSQLIMVLVTRDSNGHGVPYLNGRTSPASSATTTGGGVTTGQEINFGCRKFGSEFQTPLIINCVLIFKRGITPLENQSLYQNPWQIFQPQSTWLPVAAASVGNPYYCYAQQ